MPKSRKQKQGPLHIQNVVVTDFRLTALLWFTAFLLMILAAMRAGPDANWDLRNYHFYNGFTHLYGGFARHFFPAQFQSWHNATLDMFHVALIKNLPPVAVTVILVLIQSLNAPLIFIISRQTLDPVLKDASPRDRALILAAAFLIGMTGAMTLSELGMTFADNVASIPVLASLAALGHAFRLDRDGDRNERLKSFHWLIIGGIAIGMGVGMKLPMAIYGPGLVLCLFRFGGGPAQILKWIVLFGVATVIGVLITDGSWAWYLWKEMGNPVFPVMNGLFRSPWLDPVSIFDERFQAHSLPDAFLFPFRTAIGMHPGAELGFRDVRFAFALLLLPVAFWKKPRGWPAAVLVFFYVSAAIWLWRFGIERFAIPLEMLGGAVLVLLVSLGVNKERRLALVMILAVVTVFATHVPDWGHGRWKEIGKDGNWFDVQVPAQLQKPDEMFLMLNDYPSSYVVPFFPGDSRFVRIEGNVNPAPDTLLAVKRMEAVTHHTGPLFSYGPHEPDATQEKLIAGYGLRRSGAPCIPLHTNVETLAVCPLKR